MKQQQETNKQEFERLRVVVEEKKTVYGQKKTVVDDLTEQKNQLVAESESLKAQKLARIEKEKLLLEKIETLKQKVMNSPDKLQTRAFVSEQNYNQAMTNYESSLAKNAEIQTKLDYLMNSNNELMPLHACMLENENKLNLLLDAHKELIKLQEQKDTEIFQIEELTIQYNNMEQLIKDKTVQVDEIKDRGSKKVNEIRDEILAKEEEVSNTLHVLQQKDAVLRTLEEKFNVKYAEHQNILKEKESLLEIVTQVGNNFVQSIDAYHKTLEEKISDISIKERDSLLAKLDMGSMTPKK